MITPDFQGNNLRKAADQVVSHIRYTQHLAMMDDKFSTTDPDWFQARWQIVFANNSGSNNQWAYTVFSDFKGIHGGSPDPASVADPRSELATNMLDPTKFLTGGTSGNGLIHFGNPRATEELNLENEYCITNIVMAGGAGTTTIANRIIFDNLGRPYRGDNSTLANSADKLAETQITLTLTGDNGNTIQIGVEPETGYTHIL